jgi:hypothetical protein
MNAEENVSSEERWDDTRRESEQIKIKIVVISVNSVLVYDQMNENTMGEYVTVTSGLR